MACDICSGYEFLRTWNLKYPGMVMCFALNKIIVTINLNWLELIVSTVLIRNRIVRSRIAKNL